MKVCSECGVEKPATKEFFHKSAKGAYGLHSKCKDCKNKQGREIHGQGRTYVDSRKSPCIVCGWFIDPCGIDFHHLDPSEKSFRVSHNLKGKREDTDKEIEKCVCLCACCHRLVHKGIIDLKDHLRQCSHTARS